MSLLLSLSSSAGSLSSACVDPSTCLWVPPCRSIRGGGVKALPVPISSPTIYARIGSFWYAIPRPLRYFVSGNLGNICFFVLDKLVSTYLENQALPSSMDDYKDSISFFSAYLLHIVAQHYLHALLVYGLSSINSRSKYWKTLRGTYSALITSAIGSTVLNSLLLRQGFSKNISFVGTLWVFACVNYFWISSVVRSASAKEDAATTEHIIPSSSTAKRKAATVSSVVRGGYEEWIDSQSPVFVEDCCTVHLEKLKSP